MRWGTLSLATALATALTACAGDPAAEQDPEDGFVVDQGKEDNFLSLSAREFVLEGRSRITAAATSSDADIKKLVSLKHIAIAWFLNQYLVDKEAEDANHTYGGFSAMVKTGAYQDLAVTKIDATTWEFTFAQVIAGKNDLMRALPLVSGKLTVEVGKPTNEEMAQLTTNEEWYRNAPWDAWDPAKVDAAKKETLVLSMREEKKSADAWWDYARLISDGKIDIDVYFGWDYHSNYHLKHSRELYGWLVNSKGFKSPVGSFDSYTRASGPLTRQITMNGKKVTVEIRIIYGKPGSDTDPDTDAGGKVLEDEMRKSVKTRDVIVYSGHSGPFYGFALANWRKTTEGDFDDADMLVADMATKYQLVLAEGCDTYMIGEAFLLNPNKKGKNVDIVTTTSFSNAGTPATVEAFITRLIETDSLGRHRPRTAKALLEDLDADSTSVGFTTEYGIHGIDDDPKLHPYANAANFCKTCGANADCGGPGNACVTMGRAGKRCSGACTDDAGCPTGYTCRKIASASSSTIYASMCAPTGNVCR